jgi:phosphatidate cytidylyltransferase
MGTEAATTTSRGRRDASLHVRVLSVLVLAPAFLGAAYVGGTLFALVVALLAMLGAWEFGRLTLGSRTAARALVVGLSLAAVALRFAHPEATASLEALISIALVAALLTGLIEPDPASGLRTACLTLLGSLYVGWLFAYLVGLRELPREFPALDDRNGFALLLAPLLWVWATDIGAYAAGRTWGRTKLLPRVSPGKTVAGAIGGIAAGAFVGAALGVWGPAPLPDATGGPATGALLGAGASLLAQVGDLSESLLKRACGAKDSSRLIPGHGGVLDRFDSLLFTAPAAYHLFRVVLT